MIYDHQIIHINLLKVCCQLKIISLRGLKHINLSIYMLIWKFENINNFYINFPLEDVPQLRPNWTSGPNLISTQGCSDFLTEERVV